MANKKRIFVSYDYDDKNYKNLLTAWDANDLFDFDFYDGSLTTAVNSENSSYVRSIIKPKIIGSTHLLCLVGENTASSDWVAWEIERAVEAKKKIIAVKIKAANETPDALSAVDAA
jgi:hypothetical protein